MKKSLKKQMKKSLKKQMKEWDKLIEDSEKVSKRNPEYKLDSFISRLKDRRKKVAAKIGKDQKRS